MTLTLLLDLDGTLLDNNIESFIPAYSQALSKHLAAYVKPEAMLSALMTGTRRMIANLDPTKTLRDAFAAEFYPALGLDADELAPVLEQFYDEVFPTLASKTAPRPEAVPFVEWAFAQGWRVAIATSPLFPRKAIEHRLRWAGLPPETYPFALISSYETFHFAKPQPAYYTEFLARLGWPEGPVLMVGNDVEQDLVPAKQLGLATYWVGETFTSGFESTGRGTLGDLRPWLEQTDLSALEPVFASPAALPPLLLSTPAVLRTLLADFPRQAWTRRPAADAWCVTEILCHLRDSEREVDHPRYELILGESDPFIPGVDTDGWADARGYIEQDGESALCAFTRARLQTLETLNGLDPAQWSRRCRHAIFGPTSLLELVAFTAEHDRLHIRQLLDVMKS
ncbi:MAG: DinB family protein [Chloroflexota bacterium]